MPLVDQKQYLDQISLLKRKITHLQETLAIEEKEKKFRDMIEAQRVEAELQERKEEENRKRQIEQEKEDRETTNVISKMILNSDESLVPVTNVLVHFEGIL